MTKDKKSFDDMWKQSHIVVDIRVGSVDLVNITLAFAGGTREADKLAVYLKKVMGDYLLPIRHLLSHVPEEEEAFESWRKELVFVTHEINKRAFIHIKNWCELEVVALLEALQERQKEVSWEYNTGVVAEGLRKIIEKEKLRIAKVNTKKEKGEREES